MLKDKKPGHFHQVEGVALALRRTQETKIHSIDVRPKWFAHDDIRKLCLRIFSLENASYLLTNLYGICPETLGNPDVIVASGRSTIAAGIYISKITGGRLIYTGRATGYNYELFTLMLVPFPRSDGELRQVYGPIPCAVDPDLFPPAFDFRNAEDLRGRTFSLLIGGNSFTHSYTNAEWDQVANLVKTTHSKYGLQWNITTSRRSGGEVADKFSSLTGVGDHINFIDYRENGAGSASLLFAADAVIVTEDSQTMIAEGLAARRRVVALKPSKVKSSLNDQTVAALIGEGSLAVLPIQTLSAGLFVKKLLRLETPRTDPRDKIARIVLSAIRR